MTTRDKPQSTTKLAIEYVAIGSLTPDAKNARKHTAKQIGKLARIIDDLGWSSPIVVDEAGTILAGHARLAAAKSLGLSEVPCVRLPHLDAPMKKALSIADNAMTDASRFDDTMLREVLIELGDLDFDLELTGLEMGVIDFLIDGPGAEPTMDPADFVPGPDLERPAVARRDELWLLGDHRLLCGDALDPAAYAQLLGEERAAMVFSDPPYNVRIGGNVSGLGQHQHREFEMASGEMSEEQFQSFLAAVMRQFCASSKDGSIHYL